MSATPNSLFRIDTPHGVKSVLVRVAFAVGVPLITGVGLGHSMAGVAGGATALFVTLCDIGSTRASRARMMIIGFAAVLLGATVGHLLGGTPFANETIVLASAFFAGWASGAHSGIAAATRFFALAVVAGAGMRYNDPKVVWGIVAGGVSALLAAEIAWRLFGLPASDNVMDWRAGVRRAFAGVDAGARFALLYGAAAAVALFAASWLHVGAPYWATMVVLMVMRREGASSMRLILHYAAGTLIGVVVGIMVLNQVTEPLALAVLATAAAAFARVGFAMNPAIGFTCFNLFLMFVVHLLHPTSLEHLSAMRIYDVGVGCVLAVVATLLVRYPRIGIAGA